MSRPDIVQATYKANALNSYQPSQSRFIVEESDYEFQAEVNWDHRPPVESQNHLEWPQQYEDPGSPLRFESPPSSLPRLGSVQFDFSTNTTYTITTTTAAAASPSTSPQQQTQQQVREHLTLEGGVLVGVNGSPIFVEDDGVGEM
ncbi:hypothetical protein BGZ95_008415 [Linnemannia exigua]|uniref:Uncharacterized protein n=1 Tax=Linnemannia exigua TaxID=604196 RepID=A0AAD4DEN5_9FUNG|nr:hypothetical protein BGZ95_008415 [Linnemannia exigua]